MNVERLKQRIFDRVARHLLAQGKRAIVKNGGCRYRTPDGLKCAVGCLIPDKRYHPDLEGYALGTAAVMAAIFPRNWGSAIDLDIPSFLIGLMEIHDAGRPSVWPKQLRRFADRQGLDPGVLDHYRKGAAT